MNEKGFIKMDSNISIVILTFNEGQHVKRCIESLLPVTKNIFIVDSFSIDNTVELCEQLGAKVFQNPWKNYATQFQWGLENCPIETEWVMRLDADEYLDEPLQQSLLNDLANIPQKTTGLICHLRNVFFGKTIRHGGYDPLKLLRVWRYKFGRIESRWMDEHIVLSKGDVGTLSGEILHNNLNNHHWWTEKHNSYANREMIDILFKKYELIELDKQIEKTDNKSAKFKRFLKESIYNKLPLFVRPTMYFLFRYIVCLGFLDGKEGFVYHFSQAYWYRTLVDIRVFEAEKCIAGSKDNAERITRLEKLTKLNLTSK